jgi:methylenetetrahydrofolate reductase (NADPH)
MINEELKLAKATEGRVERQGSGGVMISEELKHAVADVRDRRAEISAFMSGFTIETTPGSAAKIPDFREHLRPDTDVYITFLPGSDFESTIAVATRLRGEGFNPIPHFAARSIPNLAFVEDALARLTGEAGVNHVLTIGGGVNQPVGDFSDTMQLLGTGVFDRHGIRTIGVAGHPEGSPDITDEGIRDALKWKNDFAQRTGADMYVTTQFCFEPAPIIAWDRRLQAEGNRLPIHIGIPGLATIKTLMAHATACGIGPSMRFISRQAMNVAKLLAVSAPDSLVMALSEYKATDPKCGITGVHVYPLGGLPKSAHWSYAVADGRITLKYDMNPRYAIGFEVNGAG